MRHPGQRAGHGAPRPIDQTLEMLRANVNRLIPRTRCAARRIDRLLDHLTIRAD